MLSCKQATHLISEAQDRKLVVGERLQLGMHLAMCRGCRNFQEQLDFLRVACRRFPGRAGGGDESPESS